VRSLKAQGKIAGKHLRDEDCRKEGEKKNKTCGKKKKEREKEKGKRRREKI
jgi:hypothetical protein